jgi:hypothetical protein
MTQSIPLMTSLTLPDPVGPTDDPRDVRAVAEIVLRRARADHRHAGDHAAAQHLMRRDTRIEHGHADAFAGERGAAHQPERPCVAARA